jgi:hypothetical protein
MTADSNTLVYNRVPSDALLSVLRDGAAAALLERRHRHPKLLDVELRHDPKQRTSWVTMYAGLSSMLDLRERNGQFWLTSAGLYQRLAGFEPGWRVRRSASALDDIWPDVEAYLDRLQPQIPRRYTDREGRVQTAMTSGTSADYWPIDREAQPHFPSTRLQKEHLDLLAGPLLAALTATSRTDPWWPGVRDRWKFSATGPGLDLLAVDTRGRLLAVEIKDASNLKGIVFGPVQVRVYAELVSRWIAQDPTAAVRTLNHMLAIRRDLGLVRDNPPLLTEQVQVVPVLAVGAGRRSPRLETRLRATSAVIEQVPAHKRIGPLEMWCLDADGIPSPLLP